MAKLKRILTHLGKNESGQGVLAIVLILLMLGAVILTPLLVFMSTGLKAGQVHESKLQEFYSADSGVEDALYWLPQLRENGGSYGPYTSWVRSEDYEINNRKVGVTIGDQDDGIYLITSTATSDDGGSTTIESYVFLPFMDFSDLLDNAITSDGNVTIYPPSDIEGNVTYVGDLDIYGSDVEETINGSVNQTLLNWPTAAQLSAFYADDVAGLTPYDSSSIDTSSGTEESPVSIGPLYRDGDLTFTGSGWVRLEGTVYVTGDFEVKGGAACTIVLNEQTIFACNDDPGVESTIYLKPGCTINGSGCIIAEGDVDMQPTMESDDDDFVLVMSLTGTVQFQPNGDFYGCLAGDAEVEIRNGDLTWTDPNLHDLNFPTGDYDPGIGSANLSILSWQIR